jgi:hypothetical protein
VAAIASPQLDTAVAKANPTPLDTAHIATATILKTNPKDAHFLPGSSWQMRAIPPIANGNNNKLKVSNKPYNWLFDSFPDKADITPSILSGLNEKLKALAALTGFKLLNNITKIA